MDDQRFGMALRAARLRRGWTQVEVGRRAGVSDASVSRIERGFLGRLSVAAIRRVAAVLDVYVRLEARSRHGDIHRLADAEHARLAEVVVTWLVALGWRVWPEVSFVMRGEAGVVDLVAWHEATRSLLLVELKTLLVDIGALLTVLDRRHRLGYEIARRLELRPASVSTLLVVSEGSTNRRRLAEHRALFKAALPDDGRRVAAWLRMPEGSLRGRIFLSSRHGGRTRSNVAASDRPQRPRLSVGRAREAPQSGLTRPRFRSGLPRVSI